MRPNFVGAFAYTGTYKLLHVAQSVTAYNRYKLISSYTTIAVYCRPIYRSRPMYYMVLHFIRIFRLRLRLSKLVCGLALFARQHIFTK